MKVFRTLGFSLLAGAFILSSCSDDTILVSRNNLDGSNSIHKSALDFAASLTSEQISNIDSLGEAFLPDQQKDSWKNVVDGDIPNSWGVFDSPFKKTRAVGVWGSYPAQYWSMIRLKIGSIDERIRDELNSAVDEIETKTNVRFYNSQRDPDYYEPYHIKLPNVYICYVDGNAVEGSGSFGLVGGEQAIYVPKELIDESQYTDKEVKGFLIHALCNAAGMFNEQQRKDRDDYVIVNIENVKDNCRTLFDKQTKNYTMQGYFDYNSITLASSKAFSKNGNNTILKKGGGEIKRNDTLSIGDISFLNSHYLPYIARTDNYTELDKKVYMNGKLLSESERLELQRNINAQRGLSGEPPISGRIERLPW